MNNYIGVRVLAPILFLLGLPVSRMAQSGTLLVSFGSNTIREFSPTGQDLGIFASTGLHFPAGLAVDRSGNVFVANEEQRPGLIDYSICEFSRTGQDLGDFAVPSDQPRFLVIAAPAFAGTPGSANCHGQSMSALTHQFGSVPAAASAVGFPSVRALQDAIRFFASNRFHVFECTASLLRSNSDQ